MAALCLTTLVLLFFHQGMPWYEFWPLLVLVASVAALVISAAALRAIARNVALTRAASSRTSPSTSDEGDPHHRR
jgi:hypothetical protein